MSGIMFQREKAEWMVAEWLKDPERLFMTSRVAKEGEELRFANELNHNDLAPICCWPFMVPTIVKLVNSKPRIKWQVGQSYAIQLGRGGYGVYLRPDGTIWETDVGQPADLLRTTEDRALRMLVVGLRFLYQTKGESNPLVWRITFKLEAE